LPSTVAPAANVIFCLSAAVRPQMMEPSTCCCTARSTLTVALPDDTCTAGASPKKFGSV